MPSRVDVDTMTDFLCDRIVPRYDDYALQQPTGAYSRAGKKLKRSDVAWHCMGTQTIGVYQITPENLVRWVMYDVDDHEGHGTSGIELSFLEKCLGKKDIPHYEELSGSPGSHHIWVFLDEPTPAEVAHNWARHIVRSRSGYALFRGEVFPKQTALTPDKPFGNLVKLPAGINQRNGNWSRFVDNVVDGVETMDLSSWEVQELPYFGKGSNQVKSGQTALHIDSPNTLMYGDVRPCLRTIIDQGFPLDHSLRLAVAMEFQAVSRLSEAEIAKKCFSGQSNYDHARTMEELQSVRGYNRPRCETIRAGCEFLHDAAGFNVFDICNTCIAARKTGYVMPGVRA